MELHNYKQYVLNAEGRTNEELRNDLFQSEIGKVKREIKERLIMNKDIRTLIDDPELADTDDYSNYLYRRIFPYLMIPSTITDKAAYILFKVDQEDDNYLEGMRKQNDLTKVMTVQFMVIVHKDRLETEFGIERHDAIAHVITQLFAWNDKVVPFRMRCVQNVEGVTDNNYASRTLIFEIQMPNNLVGSNRTNAYE